MKTDEVDSPFVEWPRFEIIASSDMLRHSADGVCVYEAFEHKPGEGRILLQTEAATMFVQRYELLPLDCPRGQ